MPQPLIVLSLGGGVQSSALFVMSVLGLRGCPRAAFAVYAKTGDPWWTLAQILALRTWAGDRMPIYDVQRPGVSLDHDPVIRVPAFVRGKKVVRGKTGSAPLTQNCTRDFKITPIRRFVRRYMAGRDSYESAVMLKGISLDEADRMSDSRVQWLRHAYPLIDAGMRRSDCEQLLLDHGLPIPRKSACVFCPWRSAKNWLDVKDHDPEGWERAVAFDERLRTQRGASLHRSLKPLRLVRFKVQQRLDLDGFGNECSGSCGV